MKKLTDKLSLEQRSWVIDWVDKAESQMTRSLNLDWDALDANTEEKKKVYIPSSEDVQCNINDVRCAYCGKWHLVADEKLKNQIAIQKIKEIMTSDDTENSHMMPACLVIERLQQEEE